MTDRGVLESVREGQKGQILCYVRPNRRSPARDFREKMPPQLRQKFNHTFRMLCAEGLTAAARHDSLAPLMDVGKGLWAFKEFDHRFLAFRAPTSNGVDRMVLLAGCVKERTRDANQDRAIVRAMQLMEECRTTVDWAAAAAPYGSTKLDETPLTLGEVLLESETPEPQEPKEVPVEEPTVGVTAAEVTRAINGTPSFYENVTFAELTKRTGVCYGTLNTWYKRGKLPPAQKDGRSIYWPPADGPALLAKVLELAAASNKFPGPGTCKDQPAPVMTKKELMKMADRVIEGRAKAEDFVSAVAAHREHAKKLETELKRLLGRSR